MGKGSKRRPRLVDQKKYEDNWARTFGQRPIDALREDEAKGKHELNRRLTRKELKRATEALQELADLGQEMDKEEDGNASSD